MSLYASPNCKEICVRARKLLNERGIRLKEILVWGEESNEDLKNVSGVAFASQDEPCDVERKFDQGAPACAS